MKHLIQLCTIAVFLLLTATITYAANWQWIDSDNLRGSFFDTESIHYEVNHNYLKDSPFDETSITVWIKNVYTEEGVNYFDAPDGTSYELLLVTFHTRDKTMVFHELIDYDSTGYSINHTTKSYSLKIIPESWGEKMFNAIRDYAHTHHNELLKNSQAN